MKGLTFSRTELSQSTENDIMDVYTDGIKSVYNKNEWSKTLELCAEFHSYSPKNCVLIKQQMPNAIAVAGKSVWKKRGRVVNENEKPISILAPKTDENGRIVPNSFITVKVYDISQTQGKEYTPQETEINGKEHPKEILSALKKIIYPASLAISSSPMDMQSYFDEKNNTIVLKKGMSNDEILYSIINETIKKSIATIGNDSKTQQLQSESISFVACKSLSIATPEMTADVASWANDKSVEELEDNFNFIISSSKNLVSEISKDILPERKEVKQNSAYDRFKKHKTSENIPKRPTSRYQFDRN